MCNSFYLGNETYWRFPKVNVEGMSGIVTQVERPSKCQHAEDMETLASQPLEHATQV